MARRTPDDWTPQQRLDEAVALARADLDAPALRRLRDGAAGLTPPLRAALILQRVQALGYHPDPEGEWLQSGRETAERGGDCEDLASLFVVLAVAVGVPARVVWIAQPGRRQDHVAAQVHINGRWQWAEASILGARIGESPYAAAARIGRAPALGDAR